MKTEDVLNKIRKKRFKLTQTRRAIVGMFLDEHAVMSASEVLSMLRGVGIVVHKTTVYRELDFLIRQGVVKEVDINTGVGYYESNYHRHHHHATCRSCGVVSHVEFSELESPMKEVEMKLRGRGFSSLEHNLEFYGLCINCSEGTYA